MKTRLEGLVESFIVIAILLAIYWIVGFIIFKLFKKEIRNEKTFRDHGSGFVVKWECLCSR